MRLAYGIRDQVAAWVAARIPHMDKPEKFEAVGVISESGEPIAGVIWHGWQPRYRSIECSAAAKTPRWLTRSIIVEILAYPFSYLGCERVTTVTPSGNRAALRMNQKLGFSQEGLVRRGFDDDDAVIMGLLRQEWLSGRWGPRENDLTPEMLPKSYRTSSMAVH